MSKLDQLIDGDDWINIAGVSILVLGSVLVAAKTIDVQGFIALVPVAGGLFTIAHNWGKQPICRNLTCQNRTPTLKEQGFDQS